MEAILQGPDYELQQEVIISYMVNLIKKILLDDNKNMTSFNVIQVQKFNCE